MLSIRSYSIGISLIGMLMLSACREQKPGTMIDLVRNATYQIDLEAPQPIRTGEPTTLVFHVAKDGRPRIIEDDLRMMHIVLASEDLLDIQHTVGPWWTETGSYVLERTFSRPGRYRVWVELTDTQKREQHGPFADLIAYTDLTVTGSATVSAYVLTKNGRATDQGYVLALESTDLRAGEQMMLRLQVKNTRSEIITLPLEDAIVYAMTGPGLSFFQHGHAKTQPDLRSVAFPVTPPLPGDYVIVAQSSFLDGDSVRTIEGHFTVHATN